MQRVDLVTEFPLDHFRACLGYHRELIVYKHERRFAWDGDVICAAVVPSFAAQKRTVASSRSAWAARGTLASLGSSYPSLLVARAVVWRDVAIHQAPSLRCLSGVILHPQRGGDNANSLRSRVFPSQAGSDSLESTAVVTRWTQSAFVQSL